MKTYKIIFHIHTSFAAATYEETVTVTSEDIGDGTLDEWCDQYLQDMINNRVEGDWRIKSESEE